MARLKSEISQAKADLAKVTKERDEARTLAASIAKDKTSGDVQTLRGKVAKEMALRLNAERDLAAWQEAAAKKDEALRRYPKTASGASISADALGEIFDAALSIHPSPNRYAELEAENGRLLKVYEAAVAWEPCARGAAYAQLIEPARKLVDAVRDCKAEYESRSGKKEG